ncbi:MAG: FKBP-type peptidyl-prolyl cis-trans isomerase [Bacteroidaceae bacterium]
MKHLLWTLFLGLIALPCFTSCSESEDTIQEYVNWKNRNDSYFGSIRTLAHDSIALAKKAHGNAWESECNWRAYLSYSLTEDVSNKQTDSIYVQIIKRGTGTGCPLGSDSVRVNYRARLIPSTSYAEGYVIGNSGHSSTFENVFNHNISIPSAFKISNVIRGFGTALQRMHIGDLWRVYIPYNLAYGTVDYGRIPGGSTLIYEIELRGYYRAGTSTGDWN